MHVPLGQEYHTVDPATLGGSLLKMSPLSLEIKPSLLAEAFISPLARLQQPQAELKSRARVLLPNGRT